MVYRSIGEALKASSEREAKLSSVVNEGLATHQVDVKNSEIGAQLEALIRARYVLAEGKITIGENTLVPVGDKEKYIKRQVVKNLVFRKKVIKNCVTIVLVLFAGKVLAACAEFEDTAPPTSIPTERIKIPPPMPTETDVPIEVPTSEPLFEASVMEDNDEAYDFLSEAHLDYGELDSLPRVWDIGEGRQMGIASKDGKLLVYVNNGPTEFLPDGKWVKLRGEKVEGENRVEFMQEDGNDIILELVIGSGGIVGDLLLDEGQAGFEMDADSASGLASAIEADGFGMIESVKGVNEMDMRPIEDTIQEIEGEYMGVHMTAHISVDESLKRKPEYMELVLLRNHIWRYWARVFIKCILTLLLVRVEIRWKLKII